MVNLENIKEQAQRLAARGHSEDVIAATLSGDDIRINPWNVHAWTTPDATPAEVRAWTDINYPDHPARVGEALTPAQLELHDRIMGEAFEDFSS